MHLPALLALGFLLVTAAAQQRYQPGDVLVAPAAGREAALLQHLRQQGLEVAQQDRLSRVVCVRVPVGTEAEWVARLGALDSVRYAERNGLGEGGLVPNDTWFAAQWHLRNTGQTNGRPGADIRATAAWDITTGSPHIVIAVLDTGIDSNHPEFAGRIDPDGYDFVNNDPNPEADHPHGSQVSGVLCATGDNGFGVAGVDWHCKVLPIKVLDQFNAGNVMWLAQGLNYVATQADVQIVSMSLINYPASQTLIDALQVASNAGKILIACAGNLGIGNANVSYPGASPLTISIGATTHNDARASFSATGSALDFVAPGENIVTVRHGTAQDLTSTASGCSFATPMTAGVVGLILARARSLGMPLLHQQTVYEILRAGAVDQVGPASEDPPGRDDNFGHGRIDARASLDAVPAFQSCNYGSVGLGRGGPYDVLRVDGRAVVAGSRTLPVFVGLPFQIGLDVPPTNPLPSPVPPFFLVWGRFGGAAVDPPFTLPLGLGESCFDPTAPYTFFSVGGIAPWSVTVPAQPAPILFALQGLVVDSPQGDIAVTNAVTIDLRFLPPPVIASVLPRAAQPGTTVTIRGSGFQQGVVLRIAGVVTPTLAVAHDTVTFAAPAAVPCTATMTLTNPDQQFAASTFNDAPVITAIQSVGGTPAAGGTRLLIVGQNFVPGSSVTIGGSPMAIAQVLPTLIDGTLPPGSPGPAAVVVTTPFQCTGSGVLVYTP